MSDDLMTNEEYVQKNWARLSPKFRHAHNRWRRAKGLGSIPDPKIDLWVPPRAEDSKPYDFDSADFKGNVREFLGPQLVMGVTASDPYIKR